MIDTNEFDGVVHMSEEQARSLDRIRDLRRTEALESIAASLLRIADRLDDSEAIVASQVYGVSE